MRDIAHGVQTGELSIESVVQTHLDDITSSRIALEAQGLELGLRELPSDVIEHYSSSVMRRISEGEVLPLAGVPLGVKELNTIDGLELPHGTPKPVLERADGNCLVVQRFIDAGAVPVAWTTSPPFGAMTDMENIASIYNSEYGGGASSTGSAQAVALGLLPVAIASDGGGSVRNPGERQGLHSLKLSALNGMLDDVAWGGKGVMGAYARTLAETAFVNDIVAGLDPSSPDSLTYAYNNPHEIIGNGVIAIVGESIFGDVDPDRAFALRHFGRMLTGSADVQVAQPLEAVVGDTDEFNRFDVVLSAAGIAREFNEFNHLREQAGLPELTMEDVGPMITLAVRLGQGVLDSGSDIEAGEYMDEKRAEFKDYMDSNGYTAMVNYGRRNTGIDRRGVAFARKLQAAEGRLAEMRFAPKSIWRKPGFIKFASKLGTEEMKFVEEMGFTNSMHSPSGVFITPHHTNEGLPIGVQINGGIRDEADQQVMAVMALAEAASNN